MPMAWFTGGFGVSEIALVVLVVVILFGARRIPELARALGRSLAEFKRGREDGNHRDTPA